MMLSHFIKNLRVWYSRSCLINSSISWSSTLSGLCSLLRRWSIMLSPELIRQWQGSFVQEHLIASYSGRQNFLMNLSVDCLMFKIFFWSFHTILWVNSSLFDILRNIDGAYDEFLTVLSAIISRLCTNIFRVKLGGDLCHLWSFAFFCTDRLAKELITAKLKTSINDRNKLLWIVLISWTL